MNYIDGYVEEVISEPYYDDYGSGIFRWWVEVSYVSEGCGAITTLMFDTKEEAEAVKPGYKSIKVIIYHFKPVHFDASPLRLPPTTPCPLPGSPPVPC